MNFFFKLYTYIPVFRRVAHIVWPGRFFKPFIYVEAWSRNCNQYAWFWMRRGDLYPVAQGFLEFKKSNNLLNMRMNFTVADHPFNCSSLRCVSLYPITSATLELRVFWFLKFFHKTPENLTSITINYGQSVTWWMKWNVFFKYFFQIILSYYIFRYHYILLT